MGRVLGVGLALLVAACSGGDSTTSDAGSGSGQESVEPGGVVRINEVVNKAEDGGPDWVELYNTASEDVDLAGWVIKDQNDAHKFVFPSGSIIKAHGFLVVNGKGGVDPHLDFGFKAGDAVRLFGPDQSGYLVLRDQADWEDGDAPKGSSWGRYPDGTGPFATLTPPTRGKPNVAPAK